MVVLVLLDADLSRRQRLGVGYTTTIWFGSEELYLMLIWSPTHGTATTETIYRLGPAL